MRASILGALALLVLAHAPTHVGARRLLPAARADPPDAALPTRARVLLRGCSERSNERVLLEQVRVELLSAGILHVDIIDVYGSSSELESYEVATLRIDLPGCGEPGWDVYLAVAYGQTGRQTSRTLQMSELPETARPRTLALALVEMLRGSWRQLAGESRAAPRQAAQESDAERAPGLRDQPTAAPDAEEPDRSGRPRLEWMGSTRIYPQTDSGDLATSLSVSQLLAGRVRLQVGGLAAGGGGDGSNVRMFRGGGRFALSLCSTGQPAIEVGTAWEIGWAQLRSSDSPRGSGLLVTGALAAVLRARVSPGVETLVSLEAGYVLAPLTFEVELDDGRRRSAGLEGSVLGVGVGLAGIL